MVVQGLKDRRSTVSIKTALKQIDDCREAERQEKYERELEKTLRKNDGFVRERFFDSLEHYGFTQEEGEALWKHDIRELSFVRTIRKHHQCTVSDVIQMKENGMDLWVEIGRIYSLYLPSQRERLAAGLDIDEA